MQTWLVFAETCSRNIYEEAFCKQLNEFNQLAQLAMEQVC